jgi:type I restriction enzyme S subunit
MGKYQAYPEYKDSGVKWLGSIPYDWQVKNVGWIADIKRGSGYQNIDMNVDGAEKTISMLRISDIHAVEPVQIVKTNEVMRYTIKTNDILIAGTGATAGISMLVEEKDDGLVHSYNSIKLRLSDKTFVSKFLHYFLCSHYISSALDVSFSGSAQPFVDTSGISKLKVLAPQYDEQQEIANFLDHETAKIDTLIEKQQQLIALLKEKRQAVISHAVTKGLNANAPMRDSGVEWLGEVPEHWIVCRLKQVIKSGSSISYGIVQPGEPLDDGIPFVQTTNMSQGTFGLYDLQKTTAEIAKSYPRSTLVGGEVILGIRASIGAAYVVPESLKGYNLSRGVARIIPNSNILSEYLVSYFGTGAVDRYWGLSKQGSTFSEVSIETVKELFLPVPPVEEQELIYKWIEEKVTRGNVIFRRAMEQTSLLQERRTALISAVVTGKIDVRNWVAPDETTNKEVA